MVNTLNEMRIDDPVSKEVIEEKFIAPLRVSFVIGTQCLPECNHDAS